MKTVHQVTDVNNKKLPLSTLSKTISLSSRSLFTHHDCPALGVDGKELSRDDATTATLAIGLLMDLLKRVIGGVVLQDHDEARVTAHHNVA